MRDYYLNWDLLEPFIALTRTFHSANWKVFAADGELPSAPYFAITEYADHKPNDNLIGFWANDQEEVNRIAKLVLELGGSINAGPQLFPISPTLLRGIF